MEELKTDPRVRIFTHLKNMGVWRTRIDGYLYSNGKYVIHFDTGDLYADEYVLEDAFKLSEKYNAKYIAILGDTELDNNQINVKTPNSTEQVTIPIEGLYQYVVSKLRNSSCSSCSGTCGSCNCDCEGEGNE